MPAGGSDLPKVVDGDARGYGATARRGGSDGGGKALGVTASGAGRKLPGAGENWALLKWWFRLLRRAAIHERMKSPGILGLALKVRRSGSKLTLRQRTVSVYSVLQIRRAVLREVFPGQSFIQIILRDPARCNR
jgi:hypothetical protein